MIDPEEWHELLLSRVSPLFFGKGPFSGWHGAEPEYKGARPTKEILSVGDLHNLPHIHHSDSIADMFDYPKVMGDENIGEAQLISQVRQEV